MLCTHCNSEMVPDNDYINRVRVLVCSNPTCMHRVYPDYPRRKSNQAICYLCGKLFTVNRHELGIICKQCRDSLAENKKYSSNRRGRKQKSALVCNA